MAVTFGTEYTYNNAFTIFGDSCVLDSTHIAVAYRGAARTDGVIKIGTITNNDEITWGDEYIFWDYSEEGRDFNQVKIEKIDTNKIVLVFACAYTPYGTGAVIATISNDDEISFGTRTFDNNIDFEGASLSLSIISNSSFVFSGRDRYNALGYGTSIIATVSGTDITFNTKYVFNSADTRYVSTSVLDSTHFIVAYKDDGGDDYGCAKIGVISGTTITFGDEYIFNEANTESIDTCKIDSTHFIISYSDKGNSSYGTAIIGTVSNGDEIGYGDEYVFKNTTMAYKTAITVLDNSTIIAGWYDGSKSGTFDGDVIEFSSNESSHSSYYDFVCLDTISSTYFLSIGGGASTGKAVIGLYSEDLSFIPRTMWFN